MFPNLNFNLQTIRKTVVSFGDLFNTIQLRRYDSTNTEVQNQIVPLAWAPKHRYLAKLRADVSNDVSIIMPRMSFFINSYDYDPQRKKNTIGACTVPNPDDSNKILKQLNPVPYNYGFELAIYVKNTADGHYILEQILPFFSTSFNLQVKMIPELGIVDDVPVILDSVSTSDTYEGNLENSDQREIIHTLNFTVKGYIYPPISNDTSIIKQTDVDLNQFEDAPSPNTFKGGEPTNKESIEHGIDDPTVRQKFPLKGGGNHVGDDIEKTVHEKVEADVNPPTASEDDPHTKDVTITGTCD